MDHSRIIRGAVGGGRYTVTAPIVKEDYGLYLLIEGLELPSTYEVDFSNSEHNGTSVTMIGNSDGVLIPSQFISSGKDVFAFLYHVGDNYGRTVFKFRIPNKLRPDRTNEEPTPEEQSTIDQAISALNSAVAQTAQDVVDADASAQASAESAQASGESALSASNSALSAGEYASNALSHAESASASATASAQSASQSAQIKADVEDLADDAQESASASAQSASASANSASQASASATSASQSATSAQGYASQAQTSAQTATAKASEASGYASMASQKATESAQSASQALTYKTDAESAKTASQTAQGLAEQAQTGAETAQGLAEDARDEAQTLVDSISGKTEQIDSNTERIESLEDDRYKPYPTDTASGAVASFPDGADDIPLKSLVVNIDPVQDLHGYDSPWVGGAGKNLFDATLMRDQSGWYNIPVKVKPSTVYTMSTDKGSNVSTGLYLYFKNTDTQGGGSPDIVYSGHPVTVTSTSDGYVYVSQRRASGEDSFQNYHYQIEEGETATAWTPYENICPISGWTGANVWADGKNLLDPTLLKDQSAWNTIKVYAPVGTRLTMSTNNSDVITATGLLCYFKRHSDSQGSTTMVSASHPVTRIVYDDGYVEVVQRNPSGTLSFDDFQWQVEFGSTATDYEPYQGQTIPITFGQTIYGGKLDVLSGILTVYPYYASYNGETLTGRWISDRDAYVAGTTPTIGAQVVDLSGTGTEIQLSPTEVKSLLGQNNIFADTGDSAVEYRADTTLYIQRLTEPDADMIADANIVSGQYFMVGNSLFKATANIASGGQVIVGTNAIRKSLSEALNEINS